MYKLLQDYLKLSMSASENQKYLLNVNAFKGKEIISMMVSWERL